MSGNPFLGGEAGWQRPGLRTRGAVPRNPTSDRLERE